MDDLYRGQQIGKYEILTQLTLGGMAELFLAFTSGPGGFRKYVVVKRILPDVKADEQFVRMFLDEARITAALSHPNIAQVFDLGEEEDGLYLAMEFVSGQNLNQVSSACNRQKRLIPVGFACAVAREVCNALHYAHTFTDPTGKPAPVIHRDVAQKNVMVTYDGQVKLLDFGIAKAKVKLGRTSAGMVKGTTGYMSPEQVRGEALDGRSDVFSVGVMLHELLTGRRLFAAQTEAEEMQLVLDVPAPPASALNELVPEELSQVVARALAKERADRFTTAKELARALERAAGRLLQDQEQLSALMRELFTDRMNATRALLESAGVPDVSLLAHAAVSALRAGENEGLTFEESVVTARLRPHRSAGTARPEEPTAPEAQALEAQVTARAEADPGRWGVPFALLLAAIVVGGGYGAWRFVFSLPPAPEDVVSEEALQDRPLAGALQPPPPAVEPARERAPAAETPKRRKRREGTLTLITNPEATVFQGEGLIGTTPLWKATLPEGTHLLRLKGPDGKVRLLSTPISANENTRFRLSLADLPLE